MEQHKTFFPVVKKLIVLVAAMMWLIFPMKVISQSLLWKISGNGMASPSYLYGTIHLKDQRVFEWRDSVYIRLNRCQAFAGEIDLSLSNMMKAAALFLLPEGQTLHDRFSSEEYELVRSAVKSCSGYDLAMFDKVKPVALIAICFGQNGMQHMEATVDELLYQKAVDNEKKVIGIETVEEQVAMMDKIPDNYVVEFFENLGEQQEEFDKLIRCYRKADLDSIFILMQHEESGTLLDDELIRARNYRMAERIVPLLRQQSTFIAIGSGHLPGIEGVIALLRKEGYTVEPVPIW